MKNEHKVSMVKLAHQLAGIAETFGPPPAEQGAAAINVTLSKGVITVKHGDSGEVLLSRTVPSGFWCFQLWPLLRGNAAFDVAVGRARHEFLNRVDGDTEHLYRAYDALVAIMTALGETCVAPLTDGGGR